MTHSIVDSSRQVSRPPEVPGLAGSSSLWRRSCQQVERCRADRNWVVLVGGSGSDRVKLAEMVAHHVGPDTLIRVLRIGRHRGGEAFLGTLEGEVAQDDFDIVLANIDKLPENFIEPVATLLQSCAGSGRSLPRRARPFSPRR
ncbi:hypothetical protein [Nocardia sp. NPDC004123]